MVTKLKRGILILTVVAVAVVFAVGAAYWFSREARIHRILARLEAGKITPTELRGLVPLVNRSPVSEPTKEHLTKTLVPILEEEDRKSRAAARNALFFIWQHNAVSREVKRRVVAAGIDHMQIMVKAGGESEYATGNVTCEAGSTLLFRFAFSMSGLPDGSALSIRGPLTLNGREIMTIPDDGTAWYRGGQMASGSYDLSAHFQEAGHYVLRWTTSDRRALGDHWRAQLKEALLPEELLGQPLHSNEIVITVAAKQD